MTFSPKDGAAISKIDIDEGNGRSNMRRKMKTAAAIGALLATSGCDWQDVLYGLATLQGGIIIFDNDDDRGCDEWYDFADPGCYFD